MSPAEKRARIFVGFHEPSDAGLPGWIRLTHTPDEARAAWREECRNAAKHLPAWAYHRDWLNGYALEMLPTVCAGLGTGKALCLMSQPAFWPAHEPGHVIGLLAKPGAKHMVFIDRASGFWMEPTLSLRGTDLIAMAEKRLSLSPAKAAWKLARICGLKRPMP